MIWNTETDPRLPAWLNAILNAPPFLLPADICRPVVIASIGCLDQGRFVLGRVQLGGQDMFWNAALSVCVGLPFLLALQIRWRASGDPSYLQLVIGWKPNGRFGLTCRFEDDASAAVGTLAPNPGLAQGWEGGAK
jgi:hypothetical protein